MIINNLQGRRQALEKYIPCLMENFPESRILTTNYGFILVFFDVSRGVMKLFHEKNFFLMELKNYSMLEEGDIPTPKIFQSGEYLLLGEKFFFFRMENVRAYSPKITHMRELDPSEIGTLLSGIHRLSFDKKQQKTYLHGNIHPSNFFIRPDGRLGIFDLTGMFYGSLEYDFALLYIHANYDDIFLNLALNSYNNRGIFSYKKLYEFVIRILIEKIQIGEPIANEGISGLKLALGKVKMKYLSEKRTYE